MNKIVLNRLIALGGEELTETEYAILLYMVSETERGNQFTARDLAARHYVSPASISRLCKKLGFGFREMRQFISDELRGFKPAFSSSNNASLTALELKNMLIERLDETLTDVSDDIDAAVSHLMRAQSITVLGIGMSHIAAEYLSLKLQVLGKEAHAIHSDRPAGVFVNAVNHSDLVVVISRSGTSPHVLAKARIVEQLEKDIVVIGCRRTSDLGALGNPCLPVSGSARSFDQSKRVTTYGLACFFLIDLLIDELLQREGAWTSL